MVSRAGKVAHLSTYGQRDMETGAPIELDTLFRIYSMTKPITSVAAMMLYEEGAFELKTPVSASSHRFATCGCTEAARRATRSSNRRWSPFACGTC